jgi:hypothetical protein
MVLQDGPSGRIEVLTLLLWLFGLFEYILVSSLATQILRFYFSFITLISRCANLHLRENSISRQNATDQDPEAFDQKTRIIYLAFTVGLIRLQPNKYYLIEPLEYLLYFAFLLESIMSWGGNRKAMTLRELDESLTERTPQEKRNPVQDKLSKRQQNREQLFRTKAASVQKTFSAAAGEKRAKKPIMIS